MSPRISIRLLAAQSDQRLLALVREGHERAFEALVQRYRRPLLRYCTRTMRLSEARAEDVLQHSLLQAWLALAGGAQVRDLKPWLYRIVHNAAVNVMRSSSESATELTDAVHARMTGASESDLDRRIAVRDALADVAALPRMQREAIFLTAVDGQSHEEVAEALGITHDAVRGLLYRARATLRSAAAAITPQSLIQWASGGAGASAPSTERLAELSAGGGAIGMTGVLSKGAVIAVTAGALVTGAAVVHGRDHAAKRSRGRTSAASLVRSAGGAGAAGARAASADGASGGPLAAPSAAGASVQEIAAARRLARAPAPSGARRKARQTHRPLAALPPKSGAAADTTPAPGAPNGPHGDVQGGGRDSADLADAAGSGSPSGSGRHGGQDSPGEANHGWDASGNGSGGERSAGASRGGGGGGSDGSSGGEAEPSPGAGQGEPGETVSNEAHSGGGHEAVTAEPRSKSDG